MFLFPALLGPYRRQRHCTAVLLMQATLSYPTCPFRLAMYAPITRYPDAASLHAATFETLLGPVILPCLSCQEPCCEKLHIQACAYPLHVMHCPYAVILTESNLAEPSCLPVYGLHSVGVQLWPATLTDHTECALMSHLDLC